MLCELRLIYLYSGYTDEAASLAMGDTTSLQSKTLFSFSGFTSYSIGS